LRNRSPIAMEPRKSPVQARSAASVDAILKAALQVLVSVGKERLTTTRVAHRAGVSVGTLYQYFPNKRALLRSALQRHLDEVFVALERACREQMGSSLDQIVTVLVTAYLQAKLKKAPVSAALYSVSSDIDGAKISLSMRQKTQELIVSMLSSASEPLNRDPELVASMLVAAMGSVGKQLGESAKPEEGYLRLQEELLFLAKAYVRACSE
jgi:AcrR family transcriptional regulator